MQIEGNNAKADDALMLDKDGYVSETNATNIVSSLLAADNIICSQWAVNPDVLRL